MERKRPETGEFIYGREPLMCGIAGYMVGKGSEDKMLLDEALRRLRHRGPDEKGVWKNKGVGLGHARLSIIDLSSGQQPMKSPDGRHVIIFNGEIYNFLEIKDRLIKEGEVFSTTSDTEVLLRLFVREGFERCLAQLRGMFSFAVWDAREQVLFLARDRLGVKPLVYAEIPQGFIFASETGALFSLYPDLPRNPDYAAIDHYLTFQYIPSPLSGFTSVRKLQPAHAMIIRNGRIERLWRYWDIDHNKKSRLSFGEACEALREKFLEATRIRLISDVPLGAFLSGGIDSSITVAAMAHLGVNPLKTFAIGFEDDQFNELPYAGAIARHFGTDHHEMIVRPDAVSILPKLVEHFGEPLADNSAIPTFYVSQFARTQVTVALTGDGGDEVFAGYKRFYHAHLIDKLERLRLLSLWREIRRVTANIENIFHPEKGRSSFPAGRADEMLTMKGIDRYKHLLAFYTDTAKAQLLTPEFQALIGRSITSDYLSGQFERARHSKGVNRYLYLDMTTYLPEDILFKVDICSMLNSLECRSPFLDHVLIEFVASLPGNYKLKPPKGHKHLLKEAFKDWLPEGFMRRNKMGFSAPMPAWIKKDLSSLLRRRLLEEGSLDKWIRRDVVEKYLDDHLAGRASHSKRLWPLLVLAEWVKQYKVVL